MTATKCPHCGALVVVARLGRGRQLVVDAEPEPRATLATMGGMVVAQIRDTYTPHTCKDTK